MAKLENWSVILVQGNYQAPEQAVSVLRGTVYDHPHADDTYRTLTDGSIVTTSQIKSLDAVGGAATTMSGTKYELGTPDPDWVRWVHKSKHSLEDYKFPK